MIQSIEQHVDWIADCIKSYRKMGAETIEPIQSFEDDWVEHVTEVSKVSPSIDLQFLVRRSEY